MQTTLNRLITHRAGGGFLESLPTVKDISGAPGARMEFYGSRWPRTGIVSQPVGTRLRNALRLGDPWAQAEHEAGNFKFDSVRHPIYREQLEAARAYRAESAASAAASAARRERLQALLARLRPWAGRAETASAQPR